MLTVLRLAEAVVGRAAAGGLDGSSPATFELIPGWGVSGKGGGREVQGGADRFMIRLGHDVSAFAAKASELGAMGRSPLYAAIDGKLAAVIAVADPVKE